MKSVPCADCGNRYPPCVMDFDHRDPRRKLHSVANLAKLGSEEKLLSEVEGCDVVCANCHRIRTYMTA